MTNYPAPPLMMNHSVNLFVGISPDIPRRNASQDSNDRHLLTLALSKVLGEVTLSDFMQACELMAAYFCQNFPSFMLDCLKSKQCRHSQTSQNLPWILSKSDESSQPTPSGKGINLLPDICRAKFVERNFLGVCDMV